MGLTFYTMKMLKTFSSILAEQVGISKGVLNAGSKHYGYTQMLGII